MAKKVTVGWKNSDAEDFEGVAKIEEDRNYEHVIGWRLYDGDGQLIAMITREVATYVRVVNED